MGWLFARTGSVPPAIRNPHKLAFTSMVNIRFIVCILLIGWIGCLPNPMDDPLILCVLSGQPCEGYISGKKPDETGILARRVCQDNAKPSQGSFMKPGKWNKNNYTSG
jgi:hypothetical protein